LSSLISTNDTNVSNYVITNTISGSPTQNIITLDNNKLIIKDRENNSIITNTYIPLTSVNEPILNPNIITSNYYFPTSPSINTNSWTDKFFTVNVKVSDSPINASYDIYRAFNNVITLDNCYVSQNIYSSFGGIYTGSTNFKGELGIVISMDIGRPIYPKKIRYAPRADGGPGRPPNIFKLYASNNYSSWNDNNSSDWVLIHFQDSLASFTALAYTIITLSNIPSISYRYYAMVVFLIAEGGQALAISELSILGDEPMFAIPEGNPITHKTLNFSYKMPLIYNFTPYNDFASWKTYANSISATTNVVQYIGIGNGVLSGPSGFQAFIELQLPYGYNTLTVNYESPPDGALLHINGELKQSSNNAQQNVYQQSFFPQFAVLRITASTIYADLIITLAKTVEIYTLTFAQGTLVQINNGESQYFNGNYQVMLIQNNAKITKIDGEIIIYDSYSPSSTIVIKYSMIQQLPVSTVY
jgi:hypothetical protein